MYVVTWSDMITGAWLLVLEKVMIVNPADTIKMQHTSKDLSKDSIDARQRSSLLKNAFILRLVLYTSKDLPTDLICIIEIGRETQSEG